MDIFTPLVDDNGIDLVVRKNDGSFTEVQIKARSVATKLGSGALFAAIPHEYRRNYWFVFYSERLDKTFIMSSNEFIKESRQNKTGKNKGKRTIWLNGRKNGSENVKKQFIKYVAPDFSRLLSESPDS